MKKVVNCGGVLIGGREPVSIQSMTNTKTADVKATVEQIKRLEEAGCQIVRVAVPDMDAAYAIKEIKAQVNIPVVADIHFDYRLAIQAIESGADKIRINPGNIGCHIYRQVYFTGYTADAGFLCTGIHPSQIRVYKKIYIIQ